MIEDDPWALTLETLKFWVQKKKHKFTMMGVDSPLATHFHTIYYAAVFVVVSASPCRDIVVWAPTKQKKRPKVWYTYILGSCGVHHLETFQASLKDPLGLLHHANHHTFPNVGYCWIFIILYGCHLNVNALWTSHLLLLFFFFFFVLHLLRLWMQHTICFVD